MVKIMVSPDQLMEVVGHFLNQRQELERMCNQLDKQIYFISEGWSGATKERFFHEYLSARQSMGVTMEKISSIAQQLNFIARSFAEADGEGGSAIVMPSLPPKVEAKLESGVDYTASALKGVGATIEGLFDDAVGTVKSFWESPFGTVYDIGYAFTVGRAVDALLGARFAWDYAWGTGTARSDAEQLLEQIKRKEEEEGRGYYTGYIVSQAASYLTIGKLLKHDEPGGSGGSGGKGKTEGTGEAPKRTYEPSPKHDPKSGWGSPNPIPNAETGQKLLDTAYSSSKNKQLYNIYEGKLIKFQPEGDTGWHPYEVTNPAKEVPTDILRQLLKDGKITKVEYNKLLKNK